MYLETREAKNILYFLFERRQYHSNCFSLILGNQLLDLPHGIHFLFLSVYLRFFPLLFNLIYSLSPYPGRE
jgi:hypothetical protein